MLDPKIWKESFTYTIHGAKLFYTDNISQETWHKIINLANEKARKTKQKSKFSVCENDSLKQRTTKKVGQKVSKKKKARNR